jgi:hypothetical protein
MSPYLSAVNQKLSFVKQLLMLGDPIQSRIKDGHKNQHQEVVLAQSATLQLYSAHYWHLQDIAYNYKLKDCSSVNDTGSLVAKLKAIGNDSVEAVELHHLATDSSSWLNHLLSAHHQLYQLPEVRQAQMDVNRLPVITLNKNSESGAVWTLEMTTDWMAKMQELVERQREMMVEF